MSSSFKYLDKAQLSRPQDAAQAFLDKKLTKNKYTVKQEDTSSSFDPSRYTESQLASLKDNGGPSHHLETKYNTVVTNQDAIDSFNDSSNTATSTWDGETYTKNSMNADDLKNHFGLVDGSDVGSGFNKSSGATDSNQTKGNALLGEGYLTDDNYEKLRNSDKVWDAYAAMEGQEAADEKRESNPDGLSINALDGLFDNLTANADPKGSAPEPIKEDVPIEYSPEIQQAKERVATYENDILSGKVSDDIYGFDATQGAAGIGTPFNGSRKEQAVEATASFLDNKKEQVKKKYEFQPR